LVSILIFLKQPQLLKLGPNPIIKNLKIKSDQNGIIISKIEMSNAQGQLLKMVERAMVGNSI